MNERYCLEKDDSCHWYLMKVGDRELFVEYMDTENYEMINLVFADCRIDGPHRLTFENPKEE